MIAEIALHDLLAIDIQKWKSKLRGKDIAKSTVRRISNEFRAPFNAAAVRHRAVLPAQFAIEIGAGLKITNDDPAAKSDRPNIILSDDDVRRVIAAAREIDLEDGWDGHLHQIVFGRRLTAVIGLEQAARRGSGGEGSHDRRGACDCPRLNPIEPPSGVLHKSVTRNKRYETINALAAATLAFPRTQVLKR